MCIFIYALESPSTNSTNQSFFLVTSPALSPHAHEFVPQKPPSYDQFYVQNPPPSYEDHLKMLKQIQRLTLGVFPLR